MKPQMKRPRRTAPVAAALAALLLLVSAPLAAQAPPQESSRGTKEFTLEDAASGGRFGSRGIRGFQWIEEGKAWSYLETDTVKKQTDIHRYDVRSGKKTLL